MSNEPQPASLSQNAGEMFSKAIESGYEYIKNLAERAKGYADKPFHEAMHGLAHFESGGRHHEIKNGQQQVKLGPPVRGVYRALGWGQMMDYNAANWSAEGLKDDPKYKDDPRIKDHNPALVEEAKHFRELAAKAKTKYNGPEPAKNADGSVIQNADGTPVYRGLTVAEIKADKDAYDRTVLFQGKKIYDAAKAAGKNPEAELSSRWLTGKPYAEAGNAKDRNGTTAKKYLKQVQRYSRLYQNGPLPANLMPYGEGPAPLSNSPAGQAIVGIMNRPKPADRQPKVPRHARHLRQALRRQRQNASRYVGRFGTHKPVHGPRYRTYTLAGGHRGMYRGPGVRQLHPTHRHGRRADAQLRGMPMSVAQMQASPTVNSTKLSPHMAQGMPMRQPSSPMMG